MIIIEHPTTSHPHIPNSHSSPPTCMPSHLPLAFKFNDCLIYHLPCVIGMYGWWCYLPLTLCNWHVWMVMYIRHRDMQSFQAVTCGTLLLVGIQWFRIFRRSRNPPQRRLPKRLVFIRHGQSEGNATTTTKAVYRSTPDHLIALTQRGKAEARLTGKLLNVLLSNQRPCGRAKIFCSPHVRARQTLEGVCCSGMVDDIWAGTRLILHHVTWINRFWSPYHPSCWWARRHSTSCFGK